MQRLATCFRQVFQHKWTSCLLFFYVSKLHCCCGADGHSLYKLLSLWMMLTEPDTELLFDYSHSASKWTQSKNCNKHEVQFYVTACVFAPLWPCGLSREQPLRWLRVSNVFAKRLLPNTRAGKLSPLPHFISTSSCATIWLCCCCWDTCGSRWAGAPTDSVQKRTGGSQSLQRTCLYRHYHPIVCRHCLLLIFWGRNSTRIHLLK